MPQTLPRPGHCSKLDESGKRKLAKEATKEKGKKGGKGFMVRLKYNYYTEATGTC